MKKVTIFDIENAISLIVAGQSEKAIAILKDAYQDIAKEEYSRRPMSEHPDPDTPVIMSYITDDMDRPHAYFGLWTGERWMIRKPYTKGDYEDVPAHFTLVCWAPLDREPYIR